MEPIRPEGTFTLEALRRWEKIPKEAQRKILDNVFCGECLDVVTIRLEMAKMDGKNLILQGKCQYCRHDVCRLVEPEDE
ncbi:MAG: hypothetical protein ISS71_02845 [Phycisphaerae bacterium]|nr:hypothetical protein [Phycisphaerae bacterium]